MKKPSSFVETIPRREFLQKSLKGGIAVAATPTLLSTLLSCSGGERITAEIEIDQSLLNWTIRRALEKGGEFAEVYVEHRISRRIVMEESKFKSGVFGISQGAGVRVLSGDKTGYAYTDELTEERLLRAAEVASYVARDSKQIAPVDIEEATRDSLGTVGCPQG